MSSVNIPILSLFSSLESATFILPFVPFSKIDPKIAFLSSLPFLSFIFSEPPYIPIPCCEPVIFIVPSFFRYPFLANIPTAPLPDIFIVPVFKALCSPDEAAVPLLFFTKIPLAPSPFKDNVP